MLCSTGPGFILNNVHATGPVIAYQNIWMMWKAPDAASVQPEHLAFAQLIKPAPDLIIFGCGTDRVMPPRETLTWLRDLGTAIEILPTVRTPCGFSNRLFAEPLISSYNCCCSWLYRVVGCSWRCEDVFLC